MSGTLSLPELNVTGNITSSNWKVTEVLSNQIGPLPKEGTCTSNGGTLLILVSGSAYSIFGATGIIGMTIKLDGTSIGDARCYTNEYLSHKSFVPRMIVVPNISAGTHTIRLENLLGSAMITDVGDFFNVTVIEFPF